MQKHCVFFSALIYFHKTSFAAIGRVPDHMMRYSITLVQMLMRQKMRFSLQWWYMDF